LRFILDHEDSWRGIGAGGLWMNDLFAFSSQLFRAFRAAIPTQRIEVLTQMRDFVPMSASATEIAV
jgi:hypothetical protein